MFSMVNILYRTSPAIVESKHVRRHCPLHNLFTDELQDPRQQLYSESPQQWDGNNYGVNYPPTYNYPGAAGAFVDDSRKAL